MGGEGRHIAGPDYQRSGPDRRCDFRPLAGGCTISIDCDAATTTVWVFGAAGKSGFRSGERTRSVGNTILNGIAEFIDNNNSTVKANECPYELTDLQIKLMYCYFIKKMEFDEIAIELVKDEQYLRNVYSTIKEDMGMTHPMKMLESFVKYYAHYI